MERDEARRLSKEIQMALFGKSDKEIPAALRRVSELLTGVDLSDSSNGDPIAPRAARGGRNRLERGGHDRSE